MASGLAQRRLPNSGLVVSTVAFVLFRAGARERRLSVPRLADGARGCADRPGRHELLPERLKFASALRAARGGDCIVVGCEGGHGAQRERASARSAARAQQQGGDQTEHPAARDAPAALRRALSAFDEGVQRRSGALAHLPAHSCHESLREAAAVLAVHGVE